MKFATHPRKHGVSVGLVLWASSAFAASCSDNGAITQLYTDNTNNLAVVLAGGFPNAVSTAQCATANGWAGVSSDPSNANIKATLLAAKAAGNPVSIVINGCEAGGGWFRIVAVYSL
jgi:hypothetical protein